MTSIRIPWRLRKFTQDAKCLAAYFANRVHCHFAEKNVSKSPRIEINIPFYGYTGGANAIVNIANLLAGRFDVSFFSNRTNVLNAYVANNVRLVTRPSLDCAVYLVESGTDSGLLQEFAARGADILVSNHGFPGGPDSKIRIDGYAESQVTAAMAVATIGHFLSVVQYEAFRRAGWGIPPVIWVIPNAVQQVPKTTRTQAAGIVGDTILPLKNVARAVQAAETSSAESVHVWGRYSSRYGSTRAIWHGFERDKARIFNSFDVLVSLSLSETQPLVVLEAMSAGIPCVLSKLPCYADFEHVPGLWFVDPHDVAGAAGAIDAALEVDDDVRERLKKTWRETFSPPVIENLWLSRLEEVMARRKGEVLTLNLNDMSHVSDSM